MGREKEDVRGEICCQETYAHSREGEKREREEKRERARGANHFERTRRLRLSLFSHTPLSLSLSFFFFFHFCRPRNFHLLFLSLFSTDPTLLLLSVLIRINIFQKFSEKIRKFCETSEEVEND
jgi:hypothetical protein